MMWDTFDIQIFDLLKKWQFFRLKVFGKNTYPPTKTRPLWVFPKGGGGFFSAR